MYGGLLKTASAAAILAAAGVFGASSAKAADLGGDCCADLEERVAELEATTVRKGNRKVSVTLSGFVGHQVMWWDDGHRSDTFIGDGGNLGSRFRFVGNAKISPTLSAGFLYEFGIANNGINNMNQDVNGDDQPLLSSNTAAAQQILRDSTVWLRHSQLGMVKIGHGSTATDNLTLIDLSGAAAAMTSDVALWIGGFRPTIGAGFAGGNACWGSLIIGTSVIGGISGTNNSCSGTSTSFDTARRNHVLYETPALAGFTVQAAVAEDNFWDVALRYAGEFSGFRLAFGIGYSEDTDFSSITSPDVSDKRIMGSASIMHIASGLWVTGAAGQREIDGIAAGVDDATMWYIAAGISQNWFGFGRTVLFGEYSNHNDFLQQTGFSGGVQTFPLVTDSEVTHWGMGVVQHIDAAAAEVFLTYKHFSADVTEAGLSGSPGDFQTVIGGMRVNF